MSRKLFIILDKILNLSNNREYGLILKFYTAKLLFL